MRATISSTSVDAVFQTGEDLRLTQAPMLDVLGDEIQRPFDDGRRGRDRCGPARAPPCDRATRGTRAGCRRGPRNHDGRAERDHVAGVEIRASRDSRSTHDRAHGRACARRRARASPARTRSPSASGRQPASPGSATCAASRPGQRARSAGTPARVIGMPVGHEHARRAAGRQAHARSTSTCSGVARCPHQSASAPRHRAARCCFRVRSWRRRRWACPSRRVEDGAQQ